MNTSMWNHPCTEENVEVLRKMGVRIIILQKKMLACGDQGSGAMADAHEIHRVIEGDRLLFSGV